MNKIIIRFEIFITNSPLVKPCMKNINQAYELQSSCLICPCININNGDIAVLFIIKNNDKCFGVGFFPSFDVSNKTLMRWSPLKEQNI